MNLRRGHLIVAALLLLLIAGWVWANPPGRFGWSRYAITTFNCVPRPLGDFQTRADGTMRGIAKTHELRMADIAWLMEPAPEVLIIALGWDGVVQPDEAIKTITACEVHLLKNKDAIELYNRLKREGRRVAIHYHSTC